MKRTFWLAIRNVRPGLTLLAVLSITLFCTSAAKASTPTPTPITSSACNYFITASGAYILQTDIGPCAPGDVGIWVTVSNVTLYLNGHTLNGSTVPANCDGFIGVFVASFDETTMVTGVNVIGPGVMKDWQYGFASTHSTKSSVSFTKTTAACVAPATGISFGLSVDGSTSQWAFLGNVVQEPGNSSAGMALGGNGHYVVGNRVNDSLVLIKSSNSIVSGNFANNNSGGIQVYGGSNNQILANTTENNSGGPGIILNGGTTGNLISLNTSLNNTPYDMEDDSPACGTNKWELNKFKLANQTCIH